MKVNGYQCNVCKRIIVERNYYKLEDIVTTLGTYTFTLQAPVFTPMFKDADVDICNQCFWEGLEKIANEFKYK